MAYFNADKRAVKVETDNISKYLSILNFQINSIGIWQSDTHKQASYTSNDIEFVFYLDGGSTSTINGKTYECKVNDLMILPTNSLVTSINEGHDKYKYLYIHFNISPYHFEEKFIEQLTSNSYVLSLSTDSQLYSLFQFILSETLNKEHGYKIMTECYLKNICALLIRKQALSINTNRIASIHEHLVLISDITKYIQDNLQNGIKVSKICTHFGISESSLNKTFRKEMHMSVQSYISNLKIQLGKRLLLQKDLSIQEISELTGFSNYNNFSLYFKKVTGLSPTNWLKKNG